MNTDKHGWFAMKGLAAFDRKLTPRCGRSAWDLLRFSNLRALSACVASVGLCGCVYALHPYNAPSDHSLRVADPAPEHYVLQVADPATKEKNQYKVGADGLVDFHVPRLSRGCAVYLFSFLKVSDQRCEDVKAIRL